MNLKIKLKILWVACLFLSGCSLLTAQKFNHEKISYQTTDQYNLKADLYYPKQVKTKDSKNWPAVIVIHGGGWSARTGDMESISQFIAEQGFVAINITYRLAPQFHYPIQVQDVKAIVHWVNQNAEKYSIDKNSLFTWGYSAGAHLAFLLAHEPDLEIKIKAVVAGGTPTYFPGYPKSPLITDFIGKKFEDDPQTWLKASPLAVVNERSPPVFIYHGEFDNLVGLDQAQMMVRKLKELKIRHEFFILKGQGHIGGYFFGSEAEKKAIEFLKNL